MTNELKAYENRYDYTVRGQEFQKGFEDLIIELSLTAETSYTIYVDTENNDIDAMPSCDYGSVSDTYYGINKAILDWEIESGHSRISDAFESSELEDFATEDEVKELRRKFEEEKDYSEDWYEDKRDFYRDYATDYVEFLLNAENENIDKGVEAYARDTVDFYKEQFDEKYYELLED